MHLKRFICRKFGCFYSLHFHRILCAYTIGFLCLLLSACAGGSRIYAGNVPAGSLQLAQIVKMVPREEVLAAEWAVEALKKAGISESDIHDGNVVFGRVECCGGPNEFDSAIVFYIPEAVKAELGDIVEVRAGVAEEAREQGGPVNVATRVIEKFNDPSSHCRWDPPNNLLWKRILYCDWMPSDGWHLHHYHASLGKKWIKSSSDVPPS